MAYTYYNAIPRELLQAAYTAQEYQWSDPKNGGYADVYHPAVYSSGPSWYQGTGYYDSATNAYAGTVNPEIAAAAAAGTTYVAPSLDDLYFYNGGTYQAPGTTTLTAPSWQYTDSGGSDPKSGGPGSWELVPATYQDPSWYQGTGYYDANNNFLQAYVPGDPYAGANVAGVASYDWTGTTWSGGPKDGSYVPISGITDVPYWDFGQVTPGWFGNLAGLGLSADQVGMLNAKYAEQINDYLLNSTLQGTQWGSDGMNAGLMYDAGLIYEAGGDWGTLLTAPAMSNIFQGAGIWNDPVIQTYYNGFAQMSAQAEKQYREIEDAKSKADLMKFAALAAAAFGGAALLGPALASAGLGAGALGLEVAAAEFATVMASSGFSAASIASSMAAIGFETGAIISALEGAAGSVTGGITGLESVVAGLDSSYLAGSSVGEVASVGSDGLVTGSSGIGDIGLDTIKDIYSTVSKIEGAISAPSGSTIGDAVGAATAPTGGVVGTDFSGSTTTGSTSTGGGTSGGTTTGGTNVALKDSGTFDLGGFLGGLVNTGLSMQGQENQEDMLYGIYQDMKQSGDYYRPWRPGIADTASQIINNPDEYLQSPAMQAMLQQAQAAQLGKDYAAGEGYNAPERVNQYLGTQAGLLNDKLGAISGYQNAMGNPNAAIDAMASLAVPLAQLQNYSPLYGAGAAGSTSSTAGTGITELLKLLSGGSTSTSGSTSGGTTSGGTSGTGGVDIWEGIDQAWNLLGGVDIWEGLNLMNSVPLDFGGLDNMWESFDFGLGTIDDWSFIGF